MVVEHGRKIIFTYQFNNEPIRRHRQLDAFVASAFQKAMLREVRFSDLACNSPDQVNSAATSKNEYDDEVEGGDDASTDPNQMQVDPPSFPNKPNPLLVTMYGQSYTSYQSAMCKLQYDSPLPSLTKRVDYYYLLQAYENCPEDPVVCTSLANTSLSRAMQRQADNRYHMIAQVGSVQRPASS